MDSLNHEASGVGDVESQLSDEDEGTLDLLTGKIDIVVSVNEYTSCKTRRSLQSLCRVSKMYVCHENHKMCEGHYCQSIS